jgi:hypothetical protein
VFAKQKTEILTTVDARKETVAEEEAWKVLQQANEIVVGRGKKFLSYKPSSANKEEILGQCLGRTGNLRAPALKVGKRYIIGFTEDMYAKYLGR